MILKRQTECKLFPETTRLMLIKTMNQTSDSTAFT